MGGGYGALAIVMLAIFLGGVMFGFVGMVSIAIRREERRRSLFGPAPDAASRCARWVTQYGYRGTTVLEQSRGRQA